MKFFRKILFLFFIFVKTEIILYENKNDILNIYVIASNNYKNLYRANFNQIYNNPFDANFLKDVKIRTAPLTGTTSKVLYLGYPVSEFSTNSFPTTKDFGIICLDGYNPTHYFITNNNFGWILGTPKQKDPIEISAFYDNLIFGSLVGFNENLTLSKSSYGNIIFGNQNFEKLRNDFRNSLNIIFGLSNCAKTNNGSSFSGKNVVNRNSFNTILGAFNLLSGSAKSPFSQRQFYSDKFFEATDYNNGDQSFNIIFGNSNITNVNGNLNTNKHNLIFGNYNMQGSENCHNNIIIGENNLISSRNDKNEFRRIKNNLFIGNNILFKGLENSLDSSISNSVFIFALKNDIDSGFSDLYDSINFSANPVDGSIFINAFGPAKKIDRSDKTYLGNSKKPFDEDDFLIGIDSAPVAIYSTYDNRIGSMKRDFDLNLYDENKSGILDQINSEFKNLKVKTYTKKNLNNSYFIIDSSNINQQNFPILSSYLVKDKTGNVIGFESNFLIPIMINLLNKNGKSVLVDDVEGLSIVNNLINISGKTKINAKNLNFSNSSEDFCFELFLNDEILMKGYNTGDLTIGNTEKKLHLYGSEIFLIPNGGDFKIGDSARNSKINLESGTNDINIGNNSTGNLNLGNSTGNIDLKAKSINFLIGDKALNLKNSYGAFYLDPGSNRLSIGNYSEGPLILGCGLVSPDPLPKNYNPYTHIYGREITIASETTLNIGNKAGSYLSGAKTINIGTDNTININIGNKDGDLNLTGKIDLKNGNFSTMNLNNPNGRDYYMLMLDSNGKIYRSNSAVLANTVSSKKYKKNIREGKVDIEKFKKLIPVIFDYVKEINSGKKNQWGLIAEDVYNLGFEEVVEFDENGEIYGLNYQSIFVMLLSSYLESLKKIEILEDENKKLKDENFSIEERLEKIEKILIV